VHILKVQFLGTSFCLGILVIFRIGLSHTVCSSYFTKHVVSDVPSTKV
jgi:hypothetical protein